MAVYKEGAFPFNWFTSQEPVFDVATPLGNGKPSVQVTAAIALDAHTVRVAYSMEVNHSNPANSDDALNPSNYIFTGSVALTASSVSLNQADPTIVDVTTNEMTDGASYNVEVQNVENADGQVVDPAYDNQDFTGIGIAPQVSSAVAVNAFTIDVTFNEAMKNDGALTTPTNYSFTDGLAASLVLRLNSTQVRVTVNEMLNAHSYTVTVTSVKDIADNPLDIAHDTAVFSGIGEAPQLESYVTSETDYSFFIYYNEIVQPLEAGDKDNYELIPDLGGLVSVTQVTGTKYRVETTNPQEVGTSYTLYAADIHDLAGNVIDPAHDEVTFSGHVATPPLLYLYPADGAVNLPPRDYLRQRAVDPALLHSGINQSTWQVRVTTSETTFNVVVDGVFAAGFDGGITGDPDDSESGLTVSFRPSHGFWDPNTEYEVYAEVEDNEGTRINDTWEVSFGEFECFEDNPVAVPDDTVILTEISQRPNCERLRQLLLANCSHSTSSVVRARTLLWYAASTGLRTLVSTLFSPTVVDNVKLCNRMRALEVQIALARDAATVRAAVNELRAVVDASILRLVENDLGSADATLVVSAIAAVVVLAAYV